MGAYEWDAINWVLIFIWCLLSMGAYYPDSMVFRSSYVVAIASYHVQASLVKWFSLVGQTVKSDQ